MDSIFTFKKKIDQNVENSLFLYAVLLSDGGRSNRPKYVVEKQRIYYILINCDFPNIKIEYNYITHRDKHIEVQIKFDE